MNIIQTIKHLFKHKSKAERLYKKLYTAKYEKDPYSMMDKGEGMILIEEYTDGWYKPQYLLNLHTQCAYTILHSEHWKTLNDNDIDWDSLNGLPEEAITYTKKHNVHIPIYVYDYKDGITKVKWQINPNGCYRDGEDGFWKVNEEKIALVGYIDRTGKVVKKFTYSKHIEDDNIFTSTNRRHLRTLRTKSDTLLSQLYELVNDLPDSGAIDKKRFAKVHLSDDEQTKDDMLLVVYIENLPSHLLNDPTFCKNKGLKAGIHYFGVCSVAYDPSTNVQCECSIMPVGTKSDLQQYLNTHDLHDILYDTYYRLINSVYDY